MLFIGASTVQYWGQYIEFAANKWINKGIAGNTCGDVRSRFHADALSARSHAVFILCGTNDMHVGYDTNPTLADIFVMVEEAKSAGMAVYIGSVSPWGTGPLSDSSVGNYPNRSADVDKLNEELSQLSSSTGATFVDFRPVLRATDGHFIPHITDDGIHPNANGYAEITLIAKSLVK